MASRRRDSGHRNKLYEESSAGSVLVVIGVLVFVVVALVMFFVWSRLD